MEYKTFEDLQFEPHHLLKDGNDQMLNEVFGGSKHAVVKFANGYGVSVVFGDKFYSNGIDTYEVAIIKGKGIASDENGDQMVFGRVSKERVTEIMKMVQDFKTKA